MLMDPRIDRIERHLTPRNARIALGVLGVITLLFAFELRNVQVDYDFEKFFPKSDPELDRYLEFRERFGYDNDFLLIGIEREEGVFNTGLLTRVDSLAADLERLPLVRSPWSLPSARSRHPTSATGTTRWWPSTPPASGTMPV